MTNKEENDSINISDIIDDMSEEQVNRACARLLTEYMYNGSLSPYDILKALLDI